MRQLDLFHNLSVSTLAQHELSLRDQYALARKLAAT